MKKFILALVALFTVTVSANAMSYEQARRQALFLTDKMAYELNLTDEQYEAAYEINLDYLLSINSYDDLYGIYWRQRNLDLGYVLLDWQYRMYVDATYFYRPLYWDGGYWHFGIYARYPHRDYYFFGCPHFYAYYDGGHSWRMNGGRSWYEGRHFAPRDGRGGNFSGMRNEYDRGDFGRGTVAHNGDFGNGTRSSRGNGQSIVRTDGQRASGGRVNPATPNVSRDRNFGNINNSRVNSQAVQSRGISRSTAEPQRNNTVIRRGTVSNSNVGNSDWRNSSTRTTVGRSTVQDRSLSTPSRTFTPQRNESIYRQQPTRSYSTPQRNMTAPSRSMSAPSRSMSAPSRSMSAPSRSFSAPSRSFSAPSRSNGASAGGSTSFGGRR